MNTLKKMGLSALLGTALVFGLSPMASAEEQAILAVKGTPETYYVYHENPEYKTEFFGLIQEYRKTKTTMSRPEFDRGYDEGIRSRVNGTDYTPPKDNKKNHTFLVGYWAGLEDGLQYTVEKANSTEPTVKVIEAAKEEVKTQTGSNDFHDNPYYRGNNFKKDRAEVFPQNDTISFDAGYEAAFQFVLFKKRPHIPRKTIENLNYRNGWNAGVHDAFDAYKLGGADKIPGVRKHL